MIARSNFHSENALIVQPGVGARVRRGPTDAAGLTQFAAATRTAGGRLVALWASAPVAREGRASDTKDEPLLGHWVFHDRDDGHTCLDLPLLHAEAPDLSGIFPAANRMQRAAADLSGIRFTEAADTRPWLRHGGWPENWHPLAAAALPNFAALEPTDYAFVPVEGEGVHEIPVGPIHAGIIEPGHFRFSVVGERILRMEARLGYQHKGVERLFQGQDIAFGARLIGRISGDTTCAYAWAYAMAVEAALGMVPSPRALALRAVLLERERIANHLGDLGALGNDAAFAFGLSQFMRLKEDWLRASAEFCGHRYQMDRIIPGGVGAIDDTLASLHRLLRCSDTLETEVRVLQTIYEDHAGLQERFNDTGILSETLARQLSMSGFAARASGLALDLRSTSPAAYPPPAPYDKLTVQPVLDSRGDVAARVAVRFGEIFASLKMIRELVEHLPDGALCVDLPVGQGGDGIGIIEGWRGEVLVAVTLDSAGRLMRVHPHDPSWQLWPALEYAVLQDIVPDFPLINKSFNLSYSGHDL